VTKDDLEKLTEAFKFAAEGEIDFVTTEQVKSEFQRRRSAIVAKSLAAFKELKIPGIPAMAKGLAEMEGFVQARKAISSAHKSLLTALQQNAIDVGLGADEAVAKLFDVSTLIDTTPEIVNKALLRVDCGNPPGKKGSLGDAINWEALLTLSDVDDDFIVVTQDGDFRDHLKSTEINDFLRNEWSSSHKGKVILFQSLSEFIANSFGDVNIESFAVVDAKITSLAGSGSFADTHSAIAELSTVTYFTRRQAIRLVHILDDNSQVNWIFSDDDVIGFYRNLLDVCGDKLDFNELTYLSEMIEYAKSDGSGQFPTYIPF
jgi:hypothetical protein